MESRIATNPKIHALSHPAYRVLTYLWGHAMTHETAGQIPASASSLIPYATRRYLSELEAAGFLHRAASGWVLHDWDVHQHDALIAQEKKRRDAKRKHDAYHTAKEMSKESSAEISVDISR